MFSGTRVGRPVFPGGTVIERIPEKQGCRELGRKQCSHMDVAVHMA